MPLRFPSKIADVRCFTTLHCITLYYVLKFKLHELSVFVLLTIGYHRIESLTTNAANQIATSAIECSLSDLHQIGGAKPQIVATA